MSKDNRYTLEELASPLSPLTSTAKVSICFQGERPNSISMPPFLFYVFKALLLAKAGVDDEAKLDDDQREHYRNCCLEEIRQIARHVHQDKQDETLDETSRMSATVQQRLTSLIFSQTEKEYAEAAKKPSRSINATSSKKNVTLPEYLIERLVDYLGAEKAAALHIQHTVATIKRIGLENNAIDGKNFVGVASQSSWSRKLYNMLFLDLLRMSEIPEALNESLFKVKVFRDTKKTEVVTQKRFLNKAVLNDG